MIAIQSIILNSDGSWTFSWNSDGSTNYVVTLWGTVLQTGSSLTYTWSGSQEYISFPPPLEISSTNNPYVLSNDYTPFLVLQWYGEGVDHYDIQQYDGTVWNTIQTFQDTGSWIFTYITSVLTDQMTYLFQVIAVDSVGNQSTPRQYQRYVVCPPVPPDGDVVISYTNPNVVISAAP